MELEDNVQSMVMVHNEAYLLIGNDKGIIKLIDTITHELIGIIGWHATKIKNLVVTKDERRCFSSSGDGTMGVWDLPSFEKIEKK